MTAANLLPAEHMRRGDPDALAAELLDMIAFDIENQDRSLQKEIGPSEVGSPCPRKVLFGMLQVPKRNLSAPPKLKAYIGQGAHKMLERMLDKYNLQHNTSYGFQERFYIEEVVQVGEIAGDPLIGHCDVYDRVTCTVIDWKTVGPTMLKNYRANGPGPQYEIQAHLYGRGWATYRGLPVDHVMLIFLPRQGELKDAYIWHAKYDEQIALDALARCDGFATAVEMLGGDSVLQMLPAVEDHCGDCDWFAPHRSMATTLGCPGPPRDVVVPESPISFEGPRYE